MSKYCTLKIKIKIFKIKILKIKIKIRYLKIQIQTRNLIQIQIHKFEDSPYCIPNREFTYPWISSIIFIPSINT